ncbi:MAG TPA: hypothetical protein DCX52_09055 [Massilia sp.]|nr:hypothetical protein [Massilia sp.]
MLIRHACLCLAGTSLTLSALAGAVNPYADHNGKLPAAGEYNGPLFRLSYNYPSGLPAPYMGWRKAIGNGLITTANAAAYVRALKDAVARDMHTLLADYEDWNAARRGWYNDPWLGAQREPIHGMLVGIDKVDNSLFPKSGLTKPFTTYVITYYNRTAAQTIGKIWGRDPTAPVLTGGATRYAEGSITVKLAFTTADGATWPAMEGAHSWPMMMTANATTGHFDRPTLEKGYLMQVDIVVKDSQSAPQTGWVFATLVYDRDTRSGSQGIWDQMVPLGAQWGNDPQVNSAATPGAPLQETWVNPQAPLYATETLGWGGRLSGPNDHALNDISVAGEGGAGDGFLHDAAGAARAGGGAECRCALHEFAGAGIERMAALVPEPGRGRADGRRQHRRRLRPGLDLPRAAGLARGDDGQGACAAHARCGGEGCQGRAVGWTAKPSTLWVKHERHQ